MLVIELTSRKLRVENNFSTRQWTEYEPCGKVRLVPLYLTMKAVEAEVKQNFSSSLDFIIKCIANNKKIG